MHMHTHTHPMHISGIGKLGIIVEGLARLRGPQLEARTAEVGMGFLGRGKKPSPHQLGVLGGVSWSLTSIFSTNKFWGEHCKLHSRVWGEATAVQWFPIF